MLKMHGGLFTITLRIFPKVLEGVLGEGSL